MGKAKPGSELAKARIKAHNKFDLLWKFGSFTRSGAYKWLANSLGMKVKDCHMINFDIKTCKKVVLLVDSYIDECNQAFLLADKGGNNA